MACRRCLSTRASLYPQQRFGYIIPIRDDERKNHSLYEALPRHKVEQRFFGRGSAGFGAFFQIGRCSHFSLPPGIGSSLCRYMSTGEGSGNVEFGNDVGGAVARAVQEVASQAPAVNEVAVAAADSFYNVAAVQHIIDAVHSYTGFNWWASIAVTTLLVRTATVPFLIQHMKASAKLKAIRPQVQELLYGYYSEDPIASRIKQEKLKALFKEHGMSLCTPLIRSLIKAPIITSFFFAILNMAEKVPSFKNGGAFWFTDLSTPDSLYIFPVVTVLTYLMMAKSRSQEGVERRLIIVRRNREKAFAVLTIPLMMVLPKAMFCYLISSNIFSAIYRSAIKHPGVKKFLGHPEMPVTPAITTPEPILPLSSLIMKLWRLRSLPPHLLIMILQSLRSLPPHQWAAELDKIANQNVSSSSVANQISKKTEGNKGEKQKKRER